MRLCCCCFGRRSGRRSAARQATSADSKSKQDDLQSPLSCNSFISEYYDAQENFPVPEAPTAVCSTSITPRQSGAKEKQGDQIPGSNGVANGHDPHIHHPPYPNGVAERPPSPDGPSQLPPVSSFGQPSLTIGVATAMPGHPAGESVHPPGASETSEEPLQGAAGGPMSRFTSCLSILESIRIPGSVSLPGLGSPGPATSAAPAGAAEGTGGARHGSRRLGKMEPGCSLKRRDMSMSVLDVREAWEECADLVGEGPSTSGRPFMVRGPDYMKTKVKVPSRGALYHLLTCDVITSETKLTHVARHANLQHLLRPATDPHLPPLLIITIMLPLYPASIFGGNDGQNQSLVYYFGLPPDFDSATYDNPTVLGLLRRFVANGREADGSPTRDRFKLIPRVVNVEEWAQKGPLSPAEHKLLLNYNGKPILTRPQHFFFSGPGYLEVDIDIHTYQFLARKAFGAYFTRLKEVVFENAFVIQGNSPEELPEQVLAAARMYRIDFSRNRPLRDYISPGGPAVSSGGGAAAAAGGQNGLTGMDSIRTAPSAAASLPAPIPEGVEEQA